MSTHVTSGKTGVEMGLFGRQALATHLLGSCSTSPELGSLCPRRPPACSSELLAGRGPGAVWRWEQVRTEAVIPLPPPSSSSLGNRDSTLDRGVLALGRTHCLHKALPVASQVRRSTHSVLVAVSLWGSQGPREDTPWAWPPIPAAGGQGQGPGHLCMKKQGPRAALKAEN